MKGHTITKSATAAQETLTLVLSQETSHVKTIVIVTTAATTSQGSMMSVTATTVPVTTAVTREVGTGQGKTTNAVMIVDVEKQIYYTQ